MGLHHAYVFLLLATFCLYRYNVLGQLEEFVQISNVCPCPGASQIILQCTYPTDFFLGSTRYIVSGCRDDDLLLQHSGFSDGSSAGECDLLGGVITARSVNTSDNSSYTSTLTFAEVPTENITVKCFYDDRENRTLIGIPIMFPAVPQRVNNIQVSNENSSLLFSWTEFSAPPGCEVEYFISTINCGSCPNTTVNNFLNCSNDQPETQHNCTFSVATSVCGISEDAIATFDIMYATSPPTTASSPTTASPPTAASLPTAASSPTTASLPTTASPSSGLSDGIIAAFVIVPAVLVVMLVVVVVLVCAVWKSCRDKGQANININNGMEIEQRGSETDARLTGVLSNSADTEHTEHDLDETRHRSDSVTDKDYTDVVEPAEEIKQLKGTIDQQEKKIIELQKQIEQENAEHQEAIVQMKEELRQEYEAKYEEAKKELEKKHDEELQSLIEQIDDKNAEIQHKNQEMKALYIQFKKLMEEKIKEEENKHETKIQGLTMQIMKLKEDNFRLQCRLETKVDHGEMETMIDQKLDERIKEFRRQQYDISEGVTVRSTDKHTSPLEDIQKDITQDHNIGIDNVISTPSVDDKY